MSKQRQDAASVPSQDPAREQQDYVSLQKTGHESLVDLHSATMLLRAVVRVQTSCDEPRDTLDELEARGLVHADGGVAAG